MYEKYINDNSLGLYLLTDKQLVKLFSKDYITTIRRKIKSIKTSFRKIDIEKTKEWIKKRTKELKSSEKEIVIITKTKKQKFPKKKEHEIEKYKQTMLFIDDLLKKHKDKVIKLGNHNIHDKYQKFHNINTLSLPKFSGIILNYPGVESKKISVSGQKPTWSKTMERFVLEPWLNERIEKKDWVINR